MGLYREWAITWNQGQQNVPHGPDPVQHLLCQVLLEQNTLIHKYRQWLLLHNKDRMRSYSGDLIV